MLVDVHADWCPTCAQQQPIVERLLQEPAFADVTVLTVDFDAQKPDLRRLRAASQSTLIAFHGTTETGRTVGDTTPQTRDDSPDARKLREQFNPEDLRKDLDAGGVVVVAGFQGVDDAGNITTLGRGGSDTSAVAVAAAMKADECLIYTDVDGVYTTDPRVVPEARRLNKVSFEEMLEMASLGSKVLQIRSVEFAGKYKVPMRVLSSFTPWDIDINEEAASGTLITFEEDEQMEQAVVSGIAFNRDEAKISVLGVPDKPGIAYQILGAVADANIEVDVIIQNLSKDGKTDFSFTVHRNDYARTIDLLKEKMIQPAADTENKILYFINENKDGIWKLNY